MPAFEWTVGGEASVRVARHAPARHEERSFISGVGVRNVRYRKHDCSLSQRSGTSTNEAFSCVAIHPAHGLLAIPTIDLSYILQKLDFTVTERMKLEKYYDSVVSQTPEVVI
jgi:hypothetical protein